MNYRSDAKAALKRARGEIASGDNERLKYAALELRFAMEALTYDRAGAYKKEIPPAAYDTWQPRKLMAVLLEIDPNADKDSALAVGEEETYGVPAPVMHGLGSEKVLNLATLKKHYDALGNHLHIPTLKQATSGGVDHAKLRQRCEEIAQFIDEVLASRVWNINIAVFAETECVECGETIRKRFPHGTEKLSAECFRCGATYTVTENGPGQTFWQVDQVDVKCGNPDCARVFHLLKSDVKAGSTWTCDACGGRNTIELGVSHRRPEDKDILPNTG